METGSLVIVLIITALGVAWLALPLVRGQGPVEASPEAQERTTLVNDYARVIAALRDLEEDHNTGKVNDEAYAVEKTRLSEQGVGLLATLDKESLLTAAELAEPGSPPGPDAAANQALDEALEAAIARYASAKAKG